MKRYGILFILFACIALPTVAQLSYDDVRYEAIPFKTVREYLRTQREKAQLDLFSDLRPSCEDLEDFSGFYRYQRLFLVKDSLQVVWNVYKAANPTEAWTTRKSSCGMMYERSSDRLVYPVDTVDGIDLGQILYMDIKLAKGLYHLATAFEITKVEDENGVIEVSYTESGVNEGKQVIQMYATEKGATQIVHTTYVRSGNKIRDRYLYPYFHNRLIGSFHRKMRRSIMKERREH